MSYHVIPRSFTLKQKRSAEDYADRLIIEVGLYSGLQDVLSPPTQPSDARGAYLAFHKSGDVIPLTDNDWGLFGGWRIEIPEDLPNPYLHIVVRNVRNVPDKTWAVYLLAIAAIATGLYIGLETDLPEAFVSLMDEFKISKSDLIAYTTGGWGSITDLVKSLLGGMPDCRGPVFAGQIDVSKEALDKLQKVGGVATVTMSKYQVLPASSPCNPPDGEAVIEIGGSAGTDALPLGEPSVEIGGTMNVLASELVGTWVDEQSVLSATHNVKVTIHWGRPVVVEAPGHKTLTVDVQEIASDDSSTLVDTSFPGITSKRDLLPLPGGEQFAKRRPPSAIPLPHHTPGGPFTPQVLPSGPVMYTNVLRLKQGDFGQAEIGVWYRRYIDTQKHEIRKAIALYYRRRGDDGLTDTATWLVHPGHAVA